MTIKRLYSECNICGGEMVRKNSTWSHVTPPEREHAPRERVSRTHSRDVSADPAEVKAHYAYLRRGCDEARAKLNEWRQAEEDFVKEHVRIIHEDCFFEEEGVLTFDPPAGIHIHWCAEVCTKVCHDEGRTVRFTFNGRTYDVTEADTIEGIVLWYMEQSS